jgi:chromosome segregation ATPase
MSWEHRITELERRVEELEKQRNSAVEKAERYRRKLGELESEIVRLKQRKAKLENAVSKLMDSKL